MKVRKGDVISVESNKVGQPRRQGVVKEVAGQDPLKLRVAWEDGHESLFQPHGGTMRVVERARK